MEAALRRDSRARRFTPETWVPGSVPVTDRTDSASHRASGAGIRMFSLADLDEGARVDWRASRADTAPRSSAAHGAAGGNAWDALRDSGSKVPTFSRKANQA
ncbi:hypothetical protein GCM10010187_76710 [Actinomadura coerulea]|nr:hypothetical protein GCM10010187_76710 [Actinomadura coerulea]